MDPISRNPFFSLLLSSSTAQPGSQLGQLLLNPQALAPFCAEISLAHPSPPHPPRGNAELNQTLFGRGLAIPTTLSYSTPGGLKLAKEAKCWQVGQWSTTQHPGLCTMRATCKLPAINVSGEPWQPFQPTRGNIMQINFPKLAQ